MNGEETTLAIRRCLAPLHSTGAATPDSVRTVCLPVLKESLSSDRERIRAMHFQGATGLKLVREITASTDALITTIWRTIGDIYPDDVSTCALFALGGYGRGELNPCSDIDLALIVPPRRSGEKNRLFECLLYLLWDLGFAVGHSTRTVDECVQIAASDLTVKTSLIEARFLAGSEEQSHLFQEALSREIISRKSEQFIRQKILEQSQRHRKFGGSVYLREPHIKEGEGGLRDFHTALWIAIARFKTGSIRALKDEGVISEREMRTFTHSLDFMLRVRSELHLLAGKRHDVLGFDLQEKAAADFGYRGSRHHLPVEHFMRGYYNHARNIRMFSEMLIARALEKMTRERLGISAGRRLIFGDDRKDLGDGLVAVGRTVCIREDARADFGVDTADFLRPFFHAGRMGYRVSDLIVSLVKQRSRGREAEFRRSPASGRIFMQILANRERGAETLKEMHERRILSRYIPEFGALRSLVQHDLYHKYTVDHHTLLAVSKVQELRYNKYPRLEFLAEVLREIKKPEILNLALLFHDIGKSKGRGHAATGAAMTGEICQRIGLSLEDKDTVTFLVANHLLMAHVSQRRELSDRGVIRRFAVEVGNIERLKMLYLLTYADLAAVGPNVWNDWKASLLRECYLMTAAFFGGAGAEYEQALAIQAREKVREAATAFSPRETDEFLKNLPHRYFLAVSADRVLLHMAMVNGVKEEGIAVRLTRGADAGFAEATICTYDAPGIFSKVAGVLASRGLNIVGAQIFTRGDGILIDSFQFEDPVLVMEDGITFSEMEREIRGVVSGWVNVEKLLTRRRMPARGRGDIPSRVVFDNNASDDYTVVEVYTGDRVGLLYTITNALYRAGIYINSAKITTEVDQVLDVFYVTDIFRHKVLDEKRLEKIQKTILDALK